MKTYLILVLLTLFTITGHSQNTSRLDFSVTTAAIPGNHSPKHIIAIWVEDASGKYINSLAVYANRRKQYLVVWNNVSKGVVGDAVTGATIGNYRAYNVTWNLKDVSGNVVPEGNYNIRMESTSKNGAGPNKTIPVTIGKSSFSLTPAGDTYFKNISVTYTYQDNTPVSTLFKDGDIKLFPNPTTGNLFMECALQEPGYLVASLVDMNGKKCSALYSGYLNAGANNMSFSIGNEVSKGVYFVVLEINDLSWTRKITLE